MATTNCIKNHSKAEVKSTLQRVKEAATVHDASVIMQAAAVTMARDGCGREIKYT